MTVKKMIASVENHPLVRFGLPPLVILLCSLLFLFGLSYFGAVYTFVAIGIILLLTGYLLDWATLGIVVVLSLAVILFVGPHIVVPHLSWAESESISNPDRYQVFHPPDDPGPAQLWTEFGIAEVIEGIDNELDRAIALAGWVTGRWRHSGSNVPSMSNPLVILREAAKGANFRCVEYSVVMVGVSQAMGMPARMVGLKTRYAATAHSGAGHVVTEIWLDDFKKWVLVDPQFGYVFQVEETPLHAVELAQALSCSPGSVEILSADGEVRGLQRTQYILFVGPYLFHIDSQYDQRVFLPGYERRGGGMMLVPEGVPNLEVFQRRFPVGIEHYTSSVETFYARPESVGKDQ